MPKRIKTGIDGLDKLVGGGVPQDNIVLISGVPGTFKTITCFQIVYNAAVSGLKSIYITFEQTEEDLLDQMKQFGWTKEKTNGNLEIFSILENMNIDIILDKIDLSDMKNKYKIIGLYSLSSLI